MYSAKITRIFLIIVLLSVLSACRREEDPTPTPLEVAVEPEQTTAPPTPAPEEPLVEPTPSVEAQPTVDIDWPPQVVYSSPAPGEETLLDGAITIRFDQPMDEGSVEEAIVVSEWEGEGAVEGVYSWPRADTVIFTPKDVLERLQKYRVQVDDSARGINGKRLREPLEIALQTVGFLDISQVIPNPGTRDVQTDAAITVVFNRPVVPLVASAQQMDLVQPLTIEPETAGFGEWVSTSIYRYVPDEPLAGGTRYHILVESGLEDVIGGILDRDVSWNFSTQGPAVVSTVPVDEESDVDPSRPITITFNMPMNRSSTESAISLNPDTPFSFLWADGDRTVALVPEELLELETSYRLSVADSARSANGEATISRDSSSDFYTVDFPAVLNTRPARNDLANRYDRGIRIGFSSPMDLDTLQNKVGIDPAPDDAEYYFNNYDFSLYVNFDLERNSEYEVTVPANAADLYGNTLGADYTWRFQTPGYSPLVSLNLPLGRSQLSTSHPSTIDVIHRNVTSYRAELREARLPFNLAQLPRDNDPVFSSTPIRSWSNSLDSEQDVAGVHKLELADGGVLPSGVYLLTISAPGIDTDYSWWQNQSNVIVVGDTNLTVKEYFDRVYVWATEMASGQPAPGRNLVLYDRNGRNLGSAVTDEQGFADIDYQPADGYLSGVQVISNSPGEAGFGAGSSNWSVGISPWQFGFSDATNSPESDRYAYLYTDRSIYRTGDTVHFRGIVRDSDYGRYPLPTDRTVTADLYFVSDYEQIDYEFSATLDNNGEFSGTYTIPDDAQLGTYSLDLSDEDIRAARLFTVADYRKPEFQVTATPEHEEIARGEANEVLVEASYFFGGAATDLPVIWTVYEDDYRFPWDGPYYSFGDFAGFYYDFWDRFGNDEGSFVGNFVTSGEGRTDGDGRFLIQLPPDLLDDVSPESRRITVEASVMDVSDFPVTSRTEIIYHAADTYVGVDTDSWFNSAGSSTNVDVITVDWDGKAVAGKDVELTLVRREWRPIREEAIGRYVTRWEVVDTEEDQLQVTTNSQGKAVAQFVPSEGGSYLIVASTTDSNGRDHTSSTFLWVSSADFVGWQVDPKDRRMDLTADKEEYFPGETARILVQSPFNGPTNAWLTIERGNLIEQQLITLQSNSDLVEIPVVEDHAPNIYVTVHAVKGIDDANPYADMRIGMVELEVVPEHLGLEVVLTPQSELLQPGDSVLYDIQVSDHQGNPVQANLSLALVDLAVLTLKADNAPHILNYFYGPQAFRSRTGSGFIISGEGLEIEIPLEQEGGMGGGGGGGLDELAISAFAIAGEEDVRRDFPDTAFWEAKITTDANGRAEVSIPLPDSLTTWRLSSKAVSEYAASGETLVGQSNVDVVVTLPILIRPITPRFLTVGDKVQLGAVIHNNTGEQLDITASLDALGLTLEGAAEQTLSVPAGGRAVVRWPAKVEDVQFADLTFRAEGGGYRDATKPTFGIAPDQLLPVVRFSAEDIVGTSGVLDEAGRRVEAILLPPQVDPSKGEVQVTVSPSLAAALLEALDFVNHLEDRPACAHAITDQLLPNVATYRGIQLMEIQDEILSSKLEELIKEDVVRLEDLQKADGGWGWCSSAESDQVLSAYALLGLAKAQQAGFSISPELLSNASAYVRTQLREVQSLNEPSEINRQAFFLYVLSELDLAIVDDLDDLYSEKRALLDPYAKALLAMAFDLVSVNNPTIETLIADLNDSAVFSASGAHWEDTVQDWDNLSSDIRGTAMVIDALSRVDPENVLIPNAVRWLMVARTADHWNTGQENAWSIMALSKWMAASGELEVDYDYKIAVNGRGLSEGHFGLEDVTESEELVVDLADLETGEVNFIDFQRGPGDGRLYYSAYLDSFIDANFLEPINRGIDVQRKYYDADCDPLEGDCAPITEIESGQQVRVEVTMIVPNSLLYVVLRDPIPAGTEAIDPGLLTTGSATGGSINRTDHDYQYGYWGWWYFDRIEYRDDSVVFLSNYLPAGTYQFTYYLQATIPGEYQVIPANARQEFFPEVFGRSDGLVFEVTG